MPLRARYFLSIASVLTVAVCAAASLSVRGRRFTPYAAHVLPQHAFGDFDGDGRLDVAGIQDFGAGRHVSVLLSGGSAAVQLEASLTVLVDRDVDDDGDLDLVGATSAGELVIWLNDGHGRFTRQVPSSSRGLSDQPAAFGEPTETLAVATTVAPFVLPNRAEGSVIAARIRPPTYFVAIDSRSTVPQSLRAPPADLL